MVYVPHCYCGNFFLRLKAVHAGNTGKQGCEGDDGTEIVEYLPRQCDFVALNIPYEGVVVGVLYTVNDDDPYPWDEEGDTDDEKEDSGNLR